MNSSTWSAPVQRGRWILNTLFHQALAVVVIFTIWIPIDYNIVFHNQLIGHIIFCTIGVFFLAESLILFAGDNVWSQDLEKKSRYWIHGVLIAIGTVCIITGISIEINRTKLTGHFESDHGIIGLMALIFLSLSLILGLLGAFSNTFSGYIRPVILKFTHNLIGIITYTFCIAALCLGYYTDPYKQLTSSTTRNSATVAACIICCWSLITSFISAYKQIRSISSPLPG
ncbi:uncharacterized protein [Onthophagus taurus]|uniref:uncharacterized protein isoform X2 n=1 Tax=Onthophagus taurus TaxID=166361 RepID=UPI000C2084C5|nr:uncharacterized protein LOC111424502 isoform X2 [Onthophagus taurus]